MKYYFVFFLCILRYFLQQLQVIFFICLYTLPFTFSYLWLLFADPLILLLFSIMSSVFHFLYYLSAVRLIYSIYRFLLYIYLNKNTLYYNFRSTLIMFQYLLFFAKAGYKIITTYIQLFRDTLYYTNSNYFANNLINVKVSLFLYLLISKVPEKCNFTNHFPRTKNPKYGNMSEKWTDDYRRFISTSNVITNFPSHSLL